jgi:hypothetical protein
VIEITYGGAKVMVRPAIGAQTNRLLLSYANQLTALPPDDVENRAILEAAITALVRQALRTAPSGPADTLTPGDQAGQELAGLAAYQSAFSALFPTAAAAIRALMPPGTSAKAGRTAAAPVASSPPVSIQDALKLLRPFALPQPGITSDVH